MDAERPLSPARTERRSAHRDGRTLATRLLGRRRSRTANSRSGSKCHTIHRAHRGTPNQDGVPIALDECPVGIPQFGRQLLFPTKIIDRMGRVNADSFLGVFGPETIRMLPPQFEIFPWWVPSDDPDEPLYGVNVTLNFEWFEPENAIDPPFRKGWNNMPWGGDGKVNGDGKYYRATRDGTNAGRGLLQAVDFMPMFTHVSS